MKLLLSATFEVSGAVVGEFSHPTKGFTVGCVATKPSTFSVGFEADDSPVGK